MVIIGKTRHKVCFIFIPAQIKIIFFWVSIAVNWSCWSYATYGEFRRRNSMNWRLPSYRLRRSECPCYCALILYRDCSLKWLKWWICVKSVSELFRYVFTYRSFLIVCLIRQRLLFFGLFLRSRYLFTISYLFWLSFFRIKGYVMSFTGIYWLFRRQILFLSVTLWFFWAFFLLC